MRKLFFLLLLGLFSGCGGDDQPSASAVVAPTPAPYRTLFETQFTDVSTLTGWTDHSSGFSFDTDGLLKSAGGTGSADRYLEYQNYISAIDRVRYSLRIKVLENNSMSTLGYGFGLAGVVAGREWIAQLALLDFSGAGYTPGQPIFYYQKGNGTDPTTLSNLSTGTGLAIPPQINDVLRMETTLMRDTWTVQIFNETTGLNGAPITYQASLAPPPIPTSGSRVVEFVLPFASRFRVYNFGGNSALLSFKADTQVSTSVDLAMVGDSMFGGYYSGSVTNTIQGKLEAANPNLKIQYFGGGGSTLPTLQLTADQMKSSLTPHSKVIIHCGGNDLLGAQSTTTILNNMIALKTDLETTGAEVYVAGPVPVSFTYTTDMPALAALYASQFGSHYIDVFTPLALMSGDIDPVHFTVPGEGSPIDGVHPIAAGHALIANIIKARFPEWFGP